VQDLGLVPGNRVLLRGGNSIMMALCLLAVMKAGLVAVATMPLLRARELGDIIAKSEPAAALCDVALLAELQRAQAEHPVLKTVIAFNAPVGAGEPDSLEARATDKHGAFAACPTAATDIALLAFTSGTTGKPKAAVHMCCVPARTMW
jgi:2-aminobenzoate-CoA ligase